MTEKSIGRQMSGCETLIMKIVWSAKEDISTQEISSRLKSQYNKDYARTTVGTFIQRLSEKGFVSTYRSFLYNLNCKGS